VLSKEQLFSKSQKVMSWNPIPTKDSCGSRGSSYRRTRNGELSPPFPPQLFRMLVLRMSDCPSPTLTAQPASGQLMHSTYWTGFYGRSATPGYRRRPWGDLVVPTGWRRWGRSMDFPSFCRISLKGLKGDSASSCSQGPTWSSSPGINPRRGNPRRAADSNYRPCTIHTRSDQLTILPPLRSWQPIFVSVESFSGMFRSFSPLLRKSEPPVQVQDTIITAWTIRHPTRNRNDPIARAELYQLSYIPRAKWSMHEGVRSFLYSFPWRSWAILDLNQRPRPWSKSSHLWSNQLGENQ